VRCSIALACLLVCLREGVNGLGGKGRDQWEERGKVGAFELLVI
jgi:hypothetical protein